MAARSAQLSDLRRRAESVLGREARNDRALDELKVHQVELAMQNEELRRTQADLAASCASYRELYDQAPVGYLSLDERGVIVEANRTAAAMLAVDAARLPAVALPSLLSPADADALHVHLGTVRREQLGRSCTIELRPPGREPRRIRLDTVPATSAGRPEIAFRTALIDVAKRGAGESAGEGEVHQLLAIIARQATALRARQGFGGDELDAIERAAALAAALTARSGLTPAPATAAPAPATAAPAPATATAPIILVVDDEPMVCRSTRRILELRGYQVITATSAADALAAVEAPGAVIDLVLSDVTMPEMTGIELAAALAARDHTLPVVLMSGATPSADCTTPYFVRKPFQSTTLLDVVQRALAAR